MQLAETNQPNKHQAKPLPYESTIKGESKFSFSVKACTYTYVKPYTNYYQDTTKPSAVSNLCRLSSVVRHVSNDLEVILNSMLFFWVFGVRKLRSKGHTGK